MKFSIDNPDWIAILTVALENNEVVTRKKALDIADVACGYARKYYGKNVLVKFESDMLSNDDVKHTQFGISVDENPISPREDDNVGSFVVQNEKHYDRNYRHPDGKNGEYISHYTDLAFEKLDEMLNRYPVLYSCSYGDNYMRLNDDDVIKTLRQEMDAYLDTWNEDTEEYEIPFGKAFDETLACLEDADILYTTFPKNWEECMGSELSSETAERIFEICNQEIKAYNQYLSETAYMIDETSDGDWCSGFYNEQDYGVIDHVEAILEKLQSMGAITYTGE